MTAPARRRVGSIGLCLAALALVAACGATESAPDDKPGTGTAITAARAGWSTGWFQAELYANLLRRLGYEVTDPADLELPTEQFLEGAARGDIDFWANGWFPDIEPSLEVEVAGVGRIGDRVEGVGLEVGNGALQGILVDRATADAAGVTTLGQLAADPALVALFDTDGNGRAEILGCPDEFGCAARIDELVAEVGPGTLEQVRNPYDANVAEALARLEARRPLLLYTWTPSATPAILVPGSDVRWLDSSPGGAPDTVPMAFGTCTTVGCRLGFVPNEIRVVASSKFLDDNPAARALFEVVQIPLADIQEQNLLMERGYRRPSDIEAHAEEWIGSNRALALDWLNHARRAAAE